MEVAASLQSALAFAATNELQSSEDEALRYFIDVVKGLSCRFVSSLPEEVTRFGACIGSTTDLNRWSRYRSEAWELWRSYIKEHLSEAHGPPLLDIPRLSSKVVVMIEMRSHEDFEFVLRKSMMELQAGAWALLIICSRVNEEYVRGVLRGWSHVHIRPLDVDGFDGQAYADFRRSQMLLEIIGDTGAEVALFLECDSVLLRPGAEQFCDYALVGAPWGWALLGGKPHCVGNGGLSIRNVAFMRKALQHMGATREGIVPPEYPSRNEDICFARAAVDLGASVPSVEVAARFSVETIYYPVPVGCHKPWQYLLPSDMRRVLGSRSESFEIVD